MRFHPAQSDLFKGHSTLGSCNWTKTVQLDFSLAQRYEQGSLRLAPTGLADNICFNLFLQSWGTLVIWLVYKQKVSWIWRR